MRKQVNHILHMNENSSECSSLRKALEKEDQTFQVTEARTFKEFETHLSKKPFDIVLSTLPVSGLKYRRIIEAAREKKPVVPVVMIVDPASEQMALEAINQGAVDYVLKTPNYHKRLPHRIRTVLKQGQLREKLHLTNFSLEEYAEQLKIVKELDQAAEESMRQYAERLEILHEIDQAILEAHSSNEIAKVASHHLKKLLFCQRISVLTFDFESNEATILATQNERDTRLCAGTVFPLQCLNSLEYFKQGKVRGVGDISQLSKPTEIEQGLQTERIRSCVSIPLIAQGKLIGALSLGSESANFFMPEQVNIAHEVADQIAVALQHARLHEQVRQYNVELEQRVADRTVELSSSNAKLERIAYELRQFIDTANAPIFGIDANGLINEWNLAAARITGYSKHEVLWKNLVEDFIAEDSKKSVRDVLDKALHGRDTSNFEFPLYTKDHQQIMVLLNASARRDDAGDIIGVIGVGQDITKRMRAEKALAWEAGINAATAELSQAVITMSSVENISHIVLEHAKRLTSSKYGLVGFIDSETGKLICSTKDREIWNDCHIADSDIHSKKVEKLCDWVLKHRKPLLRNALSKSLRTTETPQRHLSIRQFLSVPALIDGKVIGLISLANPDRNYTERDLTVVKRLAWLYAFALRRRQSEEEIRRLTIAVEQSATVMMITDLDGNIVFVNNAFEESTGYTKKEVLGQNPRIFKTDYLPDNVYKHLWETISKGHVWNGKFLNKRKDKSLYWEKAIITPITDSKGNIVNYIAVKEDITQQKTAEEALKKAKAEAEVANRLKTEFLANMSHEIRTPMNAILGFTELLFEDEDDLNKREKLKIIQYSGNQLLTLINDILDFSKIEAGKLEIEKKPFRLRRMFENICHQFEVKATEQSLSFTIEIEDGVPPVVIGDEHRISQIILNIVSNAFKFTPEGGSVHVDCLYSDGIVTIKITDTGIGIPKEKHQLIFSAFEQADASISRRHGGTGLGLAITKKLVGLMAGELSLESQVNVGSSFTVKLPLLPSQTKTEEKNFSLGRQEEAIYGNRTRGESMVQLWLQHSQEDPALEKIILEGIKRLSEKIKDLESALISENYTDIRFIAHTMKGWAGNLGFTEIQEKVLEIEHVMKYDQSNVRIMSSILSKLKNIISDIPEKYLTEDKILPQNLRKSRAAYHILVAEDDEINQMVIQEFLKKMSLSCDLAANGKIALQKLKKTSYDLLLLDMQMPVMNGIDVIKHIRSDGNLKDLYVVALTAYAMKGDARKYIDLGCNAYLSKPINKKTLQNTIFSVLPRLTKGAKKSVDSSDSEILREPDFILSQKNLQELHCIIRELKEHCDIFDPGRIYPLADRLINLSSAGSIELIKKELYTAADMFDDQAIKPIIRKLEEMLHDYERQNTHC